MPFPLELDLDLPARHEASGSRRSQPTRQPVKRRTFHSPHFKSLARQHDGDRKTRHERGRQNPYF